MCSLLLRAQAWIAVSYSGAGHKGGLDQLALLPLNPLVIPLLCPGTRVMTWTAPCARPAVSTGLAQMGAFYPLSGGCPVEVQDRPLVETGSPGSELLCSQPYGKCEQGRTKQHRSLLASVSGTQQNAVQSWQGESALAENLISGRVQDRKEGDAGALVSRMQPRAKNNRERNPGGKAPASKSRGSAPLLICCETPALPEAARITPLPR